MKICFLAALTILLTFSAPSARARLDETPEQCEARYGKPIKEGESETVPGETVRLYVKNGMEVMISFVQGKAGSVDFHRVDKANLAVGEIDTLLQANRGTFTWKLSSVEDPTVEKDGKRNKNWDRSDGATAALLYSDSGRYRFLTVETKWYHDYYERVTKPANPAAKPATNGLEGF